MVDMDDVRERVGEKAREAVGEVVAGDDEPESPSVAMAVDEGWDLTEYNAFFSDCRSAGFSASDCGSVWTEAKEDGMTSGGSLDAGEDDSTESSAENDILLLTEGADSSDRAATLLADSVMDGDVEAVLASTPEGQGILESLGTVPDTPAHVVSDGGGVRVGDLESLFEQELVS
jgi:hypothetical protein